jgi:predicted permease
LVEGRVVGFTLGTALLVGLLAGMVSSVQSRRIDVSAGLKADSRQGGLQRSWMRSGLLATQAALSAVLLVGAGLFLRSLGNVNALDLGYDIHALSAVRLPLGRSVPDQYEILASAATRLREVPGVSGVALATSAPMLGNSGQMVFLPDRDSVPELPSGFNSVSPEFFGVTGTQILQGRTFHADEVGSAVIVSTSLARRYWPGESALGKCLILGSAEASCSEVVGVVEDVRFREIIEDPTLQYFVPLDLRSDSRAPRSIVLRVDASAWPAAAEVARAELAPHLDLADVRFTRVSEALDPQLRPWRLGAQLFTAFGLLALVVTVVGFYSVTSYAVSQRTHEMGVRIALGARMRNIIALVLREGAALTLIGVALGIAVALALGRLVATLLYEVTPRDPAVMTGAGLVLLAVGLVASLVPAWRAARIDPVRALTVD